MQALSQPGAPAQPPGTSADLVEWAMGDAEAVRSVLCALRARSGCESAVNRPENHYSLSSDDWRPRPRNSRVSAAPIVVRAPKMGITIAAIPNRNPSFSSVDSKRPIRAAPNRIPEAMAIVRGFRKRPRAAPIDPTMIQVIYAGSIEVDLTPGAVAVLETGG